MESMEISILEAMISTTRRQILMRQSQGQELSEEQMQLFEEENRGLFEHLNDQLAKVTQAEKSLMEISSLQQTLVGHLSVQGEMIGQLVEDASNTDENVRKGNKELKRASERSSTAKGRLLGNGWIVFFLGCMGLDILKCGAIAEARIISLMPARQASPRSCASKRGEPGACSLDPELQSLESSPHRRIRMTLP